MVVIGDIHCSLCKKKIDVLLDVIICKDCYKHIYISLKNSDMDEGYTTEEWYEDDEEWLREDD